MSFCKECGQPRRDPSPPDRCGRPFRTPISYVYCTLARGHGGRHGYCPPEGRPEEHTIYEDQRYE